MEVPEPPRTPPEAMSGVEALKARFTPRAGLSALARSPLARRRVPDDLAADHRHHRLNILDLIGGYGEVIAVQHHEIGELARGDGAEIVFLENEIGVVARMRDERVLARDRLFVHDIAADHLAGHRKA